MASSVPEEKKVKRIVKVLKQIAENLNQDEIISLRSTIKQTIELSRDYNENKVRKLLEMRVEKLLFHPGISGNLMKQSMRSLLMIRKNEQLGKTVYEKFTHYILREHSSIAIGMEWDDDLLKAYFKALEKGHERAHHARVMVVGMYKAGKTTLVSKLLEKPSPNSSTVLIDISVDACEVDDDGKWQETTFEEKETRYRVRLQKLFKSNQEKDKTNAEMDISDNGNQNQVNQVIHMEETNGAQATEGRLNILERNMSTLKQEFDKASNIPQPNEYYKTIEKAKDSAKNHADLEKRPTVAIWDFAGQSVYYSTHQFFLNPRSIYLLVLDLSKNLHENVDEGEGSEGAPNLHIGNNTTTDFTQHDAFQFWMRSIYFYTQQKDTQIKYEPTIVLVGTHKDACGYEGEKADAFAENYFKRALKPFDGKSLMKLIHKKKFFVSKNESSDVFDSLRKELNYIATKQLFWEEAIPAKFIPLEREVEKRKSNKEDILQFHELESVSDKSHYPLTTEEIRVFLGFQHAFGNILYYHKANPDTIILDPKWIINALKIFVTHKKSLSSKEWTQFTEIGILSETLIDQLLKAEGDYWVPFKEKIICYMEHLDIIAKPVKDTQYTQESQESQRTDVWVVKINPIKDKTNTDFYPMPLRFPRRPSTDRIKEMLGWTCRNTWISSPVLCMYIKGSFLPPFVFHRIIAKCIKHMPVVEHKEKWALFNGFGAFHIDATTILTTWSWDDMIYVKVTSYNIDEKSRMEEADLQCVRKYFKELIMRTFETEIEISNYVTCPKCPEHFPFDRDTDDEGFPIDQKKGLLLVENLRIVDQTLCNPAKHHVDACKALKNWFPDDTKINVDSRLIESTFDERFLADLSDEIDIDKLCILASKLNISERELKRIQNNHKPFVSNATFHILYEWGKIEESLAILLNAVKAAGCREEDFYRILKGIDNDQTKTRLNNITQKLSTYKLEQIELGEKECKEIAHHIGLNYLNYLGIRLGTGLNYWYLGIRLGVPESDIQHMHTTTVRDTKTIVKDILLKWRRKPKGQTNREINEELIRAMVKSSCEMKGVIKIFGRSGSAVSQSYNADNFQQAGFNFSENTIAGATGTQQSGEILYARKSDASLQQGANEKGADMMGDAPIDNPKENSSLINQQRNQQVNSEQSELIRQMSELQMPGPKGRTFAPTIIHETLSYHEDIADGRVLDVDVEELEKVIVEGEELQSGSTGKVYCSKESIPQWGFRIAVKKIPCTEVKLQSITNEVVAARIKHQGIVPLLAKTNYKDKDHAYFVFKYMEKGDLMNAIREDMEEKKENVHMGARQRVLILYQIACAMCFIHTPVKGFRGSVIHGDITTRNIVLDKKYNAHLLDFGVARELEFDQNSIQIRTGEPIGTPGYTTVHSKKELSQTTDCKNFGVVILELLTGGVPKEGDRELKKFPLDYLKASFTDCYKSIWENIEKDQSVYTKLKNLAAKCLNGEMDSKSLTESLYEILIDGFNFDWEGEDGSVEETGESKKQRCSLCIINWAVDDLHNLRLDGCGSKTKHISPPVCVPCMRNSYLNPIMCRTCRMTIHTNIGNSMGAILVEGFAKDGDGVAFKNDVKSMEKILTSKYPLVFGLDPANVIISTTKEGLRNAVDELNVKGDIATIFIYYSGHYTKMEGFTINSNLEIENFSNDLKRIDKDIILVIDCCKAGSIEVENPNIVLRINSSTSDEDYRFNEHESIFTKFFIQATKQDRCPDECRICEDYKPDNLHKGFISREPFFHYIKKHIDRYCKTKGVSFTPTMNDKKGFQLGYHIAGKREIKFDLEDGNDDCTIGIGDLPYEMSELRNLLLEKILKNKFGGQNKNRYVMAYFAWRTMIGLNEEIKYLMQLPGHARCIIDAGFANIKKLYRRTDCETLADIGDERSWSDYWKDNEKRWQNFSDTLRVRITKGPRPEDKSELISIPQVVDAWNKKFELNFGFRDEQNIEKGNVGMVLKNEELDTQKIVDMLQTKRDHYEACLEFDMVDKQTKLTVLCDTFYNKDHSDDPEIQWLKKTVFDILVNQKLQNHQRKKLIITILPELRDEGFPLTERFLMMEIPEPVTS